MKVILAQEERDRLVDSLLDDSRKLFMSEHVKRGKRTAFARALAKSKGVQVTDTMTDEEIERFIDDWLLVDFMDMGPGYASRGMTCECGRTLRYVYVVLHKVTGQRLQLGKEHFEEHTMIPAGAVKQILQGMEAIDYEMDELLVKLHDSWSLKQAFPQIPPGFILPPEMDEQLKLGLPLLDRQIEKLRTQLRRHTSGEAAPVPILPVVKPKEAPRNREPETFVQASLDFFVSENDTGVKGPLQFAFDFGEAASPVAAANRKTEFLEWEPPAGKEEVDLSIVHAYIYEGIQSTRAIAELLITKHGYSDKRFVTGKPKLYPGLCAGLDKLVLKGEAVLIHAEPSHEDRIYGPAAKKPE